MSQNAREPSGAFFIRSASVDGMVRWQAWHVVPTSRAMPTPWAPARRCSYAPSSVASTSGTSASRACCSTCTSASMSRSASASDAVEAIRLGRQLGAAHGERRQLGVERLALLHDLELAVLDVAPVTLQLLDVGLHRLQLAR